VNSISHNSSRFRRSASRSVQRSLAITGRAECRTTGLQSALTTACFGRVGVELSGWSRMASMMAWR